jgi:hypothetical protein
MRLNIRTLIIAHIIICAILFQNQNLYPGNFYIGAGLGAEKIFNLNDPNPWSEGFSFIFDVGNVMDESYLVGLNAVASAERHDDVVYGLYDIGIYTKQFLFQNFNAMQNCFIKIGAGPAILEIETIQSSGSENKVNYFYGATLQTGIGFNSILTSMAWPGSQSEISSCYNIEYGISISCQKFFNNRDIPYTVAFNLYCMLLVNFE